MTNLKYLPGLVPFTVILYILIVCLAYYLYYRDYLRNPPSSPSIKYSQDFHVFPASSVSNTPFWRAWAHFWQGRSLNSATQSCFETPLGDYVLLLYRFGCFCYFFGVIFLWGYEMTGGANAFYFTLWNVDLVTLFYLLATIASMSRLYLTAYHPSAEVTPRYLRMLSNSVQIIFEFATATAFFVTLVAFTALNPHFAFWNVNQHFVTSMSLLGELMLNKMGARYEHVIFQISWAFLYLLFCWPMVASGALPEWPYFFLKTGTAAVFAYYAVLFLLNVVFFLLFCLLVRCKERLLTRWGVKFEGVGEWQGVSVGLGGIGEGLMGLDQV